MNSRSSFPHHIQNQGSIIVTFGRRQNDGDKTTVANEGIFALPNAAGHGQPFLRLYLPFCMGEGPISSVFCRPGTLIVLCPCTVKNH